MEASRKAAGSYAANSFRVARKGKNAAAEEQTPAVRRVKMRCYSGTPAL